MPSVVFTDEEVANLRWLLDAIGAGPPKDAIEYLTNARTGAWAASARAKLADVDAGVRPLKSNDQLRIDLGRFAADNATQEEVENLRAMMKGAQDNVTAAHAKLDELGADQATKPGDLAGRITKLDAKTKAAVEP